MRSICSFKSSSLSCTAIWNGASFQPARRIETDFSSDYINPIDLCNRLNTYIVPEAAVHGFLTFLFLINGYWLALLLNLPLLAFNAKKIFENQHLLDATEIFRKLNVHKKVSLPRLMHAAELTTDRNHLSNWVFICSCSSSISTA